ncbi:M4 family metallopeptidase [Salinisphaera sp. Q1T1-3]|uniref:M4 family metallopeptidase n=1 Tax=Salinisphaera sp. Q1T1-3 TaxID=2321229 RepID=UPI000E7689EF|nr:M4 family metallopeptidase [Salinisphaera sp. Q1T1-3]RJS93091.1 M4 family peptidase [Salinisphaera sp. Q1T1-3]
MHETRARRRGIVPPHMLERLKTHADSGLRRCAETTQALDEGLLAVEPSEAAALPRRAAGLERTLYDANHTQRLPGTPMRGEGDAPVADREVNEGYDDLGATYRFYADVFDRDSIDDAGMPLDGSVHYGRDYMNAFWNGREMVFGDGDGRIFKPFTRSLNVVAHELTHGVTGATIDLVYEGQSGALNESISDVFGAMTEQYANDETAAQASWLIGAELLTEAVQGRALRDMAQPGTAYDDDQLGQDPQPADMAHYVDTRQDNGGVHINSGIPNRAFYLAATALSGHSWVVAGHIWYAALTDSRLARDTDFAGFAAVTTALAEERFDSTTRDAVRKAWQAVGVDV